MVLSKNLQTHIENICNIGIRLAGSANERRAAEYAAEKCRSYGVQATIEDFPVMERCVEEEHLFLRIDGQWQEFPCSLFGASVSTGGKMLEADVVWFDSHTDYQRGDLSYLKGKAVVHLGCHIETAGYYRALMLAEPAFLIFVDTRFTSSLPLADGLFPAYSRKYGAKPTVNAAYFDAWKWKKEKADKARLCVTGTFKKSLSCNMIAEIPGTAPELGCVYAGGHHDTQAGTVGADDNATGTAAMIELARMLSAKPHLRTIRLISFGAEEHLSLGSASYVRRHRLEVEKNGVFMANFDTYGSLMGWNCLQSIGTDEQLQLLKDIFKKQDLMLAAETEVSPYVDNFPFNAAGVPSFWIYRRNCVCGHFYHHRADATPDKLDFDLCASIVLAGAEVISFFADTRDISACRNFTETQKSQIRNYWESVYGGWQVTE